MRLIDVDALPSGRVEWDDILEAPTVDAVPVRHGKWSVPHGHPNARVCSVCMMICHEDNARFYNYCPHCGARMDENDEVD